MRYLKEEGISEKEYILKHIQDKPYPGQEKVAKYLERGNVMLVAPSCGYDVFTGEIIVATRMILTDGEYSWENTLPHYVRQYNLRLPEEFEGKIMGIGFTAATLPNAE